MLPSKNIHKTQPIMIAKTYLKIIWLLVLAVLASYSLCFGSSYNFVFIEKIIKSTLKNRYFKLEIIYEGNREGAFIQQWDWPRGYFLTGYLDYGDGRKIIKEIKIDEKRFRWFEREDKWRPYRRRSDLNPFDFLREFQKIKFLEDEESKGIDDMLFELSEPLRKYDIISWHRDKALVWVDGITHRIKMIIVKGFMDGSTKETIRCYDFGQENLFNTPINGGIGDE